MNNGTGYPASSKRRSNKREEESSMDSGHNARSSKAEPTRVATTHLTDSEIRVAEQEIAHQQHAENRQCGNSHGHHAIAIPAHRDNKIRDDEVNCPLDRHNHHRHQCDDNNDSDHDDSQHHLIKSANAPASTNQAPSSLHATPKPKAKLRSSKQPNPHLQRHCSFLTSATNLSRPRSFDAYPRITKGSSSYSHAAVPKHAPSAPQQDHRQAHTEDIDHYAHPTPEEEIAHQRHVENYQRGNIDSHHAIAVPAHRDNKIPRHSENEDLMDHHDHYRHQYEESRIQSSSDFVNSLELNLGSLFSAANASGLGNYTYSDAVTHSLHRHPHATAPTPKTTPRYRVAASIPKMNLGALFAENQPQSRRQKVQASQYREHLNRSFGHHNAPSRTPSQRLLPHIKRIHQLANKHRTASAEIRTINTPTLSLPIVTTTLATNTSTTTPPTSITIFVTSPHDEYYGEYQDDFGNLLPTAAVDSPLQSMRSMFRAENSNGLKGYTFSEAFTHQRRHRTTTMSASVKKRTAHKPKRTFRASHQHKRQQHLSRSFGHRGHHAQHDMSSVEGAEYDFQGPSIHLHQRRSEAPLFPLSWLDEPTRSASTKNNSAVASAPKDAATEITTHIIKHEYDDAIDKHNHFRHQPHDQICGEHHDAFGNLIPTAIGDSPLLSMRKLFSAGNSSGLGDYTYAEVVTHK
ncbi:MAG: hypothetical protein JOS17DRAFT_793651 [Linnemannia elongata]|nr:MAG: hypothetical protein JOS17DRAFT_793651 [Linnemannia elongata]